MKYKPEEMAELRKNYPDYSPGDGERRGGGAENLGTTGRQGYSPTCMTPKMVEKVVGPSSHAWQKLGLGAGKGVGLKYGKVVDLSESFTPFSQVLSQGSQSQQSQSSSSSSSSPQMATLYTFEFIERHTTERDSFLGEEVLFSTQGDGPFLDEIDVPRLGIISDIKLQDFMSHHNFFIKFHPNVNFVVGLNGSGKSAILAALRVGLGVSARVC